MISTRRWSAPARSADLCSASTCARCARGTAGSCRSATLPSTGRSPCPPCSADSFEHRLQLLRIEQLEQHHVLPLVRERLHALQQRLRVACRNPRSRRRARGRARSRGSARTESSCPCPCRARVRSIACSTLLNRPLRVDAGRCSRILSSNTMRPTASCCRAARYASVAARNLRVLELRDLAAAKAHRRARVEQDHEPRVGFADVALDVRAVGARVHVPVDEPRVVTLGVQRGTRRTPG